MKVELRDVADDDLQIFFEHQRDPEAVRMAAFPAREREPFFTHWRKKVLADAANGKQTVVVDGQVAGNIVSWQQDGKRLVGYWIGREYWGKGVATAALEGFLANYEHARPLHAFVAKQNLGSIRVLEKCGFRRCVDGDQTGGDGVEEFLFEFR